ncbi:flagellin [Atlantibacter sp. RC6]|uniref:flagellin N-terminal helical domain-containing protein n=1 Tax=Atlantibacter sp. RC6 TaxID=2587036 RepID=UPI0016066140|nr:flagellin [Atlantibacter sp. RC6]MBB3320647.1 flagellin [Atlantibacter sp. RC6]
MAQVINTNSLSLLTQNNLNKSQSSLSSAIERLSSGLRINSAKDDAAGQAIANRFTSNIKGLTQASRNANDGISIAQTTEGSLNEINNNLQRIRELAVQASNDTNSTSDLDSIQAEITQRLGEIDRVSQQTQFNGVKVLSKEQGLTIQVGANDNETITINLQEINSSTLGLDGFSVQKQAKMTDAEVTSFGTATGTNSPIAIADSTALDLSSIDTNAETDGKIYTDGDKYFIQVTDSSDDSQLGIYEVSIIDDSTQSNAGELTLLSDSGKADLTGLTETTTVPDTAPVAGNVNVKIDPDTTAAIQGAKLVKLTDEAGKDAGYAIKGTDNKYYAAKVDEATGDVSMETVSYTDAKGNPVTDAKVQIGGLDGKTKLVTVGTGDEAKTYKADELKGKDLRTDAVAVAATETTANPLAALDKALAKVDTFRSDLGAIQNRFDSAITNLGNTVNNLSSARSRIEDADYATEVSNMSRAQILQQAGTSVLAQANQVTQNVLSLLR